MLNSIVNLLQSLVNFILYIFEGLKSVIEALPRFIDYITESFTLLPSFVGFFVAGLLIIVIVNKIFSAL